MSKLKSIISPNNIALIGASSDLQKSAGRLVINLINSRYKGDIYLVNPRYKQLLNMKSYSTILEIEDDIDLACIITPASTVLSILEQCIEKNVKSVIILCSGFSENGIEGRKLEQEIKELIADEDIIVYGPNAPGFFSYVKQWGISFSPKFEPKKFKKGKVGLISHGGSLGRAITDANERGIGFSYWLSPGNELGVDLNDCLEFLIEDPNTEIILLVVESYASEQRFKRLVDRAFRKSKPIIILSIGTTNESLPAVRFHLGKKALSIPPKSVKNHPGIIEVDSITEMISASWMFEYYDLSDSERTLIYSWTGGASIYLADLCTKYKIKLPDLSNELKGKLKEIVNIKDYFINPLDITTAVYENLDIMIDSFNLIVQSNEYDTVIILFPFEVGYQNEVLAKEILNMKSQSDTLFIPVFLSQGNREELGMQFIQESRIPYFTDEHIAVKTLSRFLKYSTKVNGGVLNG